MRKFFGKEPKEEEVIHSIRTKLQNMGFETLDFHGIDIVARNQQKPDSDILLIEVKTPKEGYVTLDNVAQVNSAAQAYLSGFNNKDRKIKPILIGNYTLAGSTQSIAGLNNVQLIKIDPGDTLDDITNKVDNEFAKIFTDVS
jgi:hypothetical protein